MHFILETKHNSKRLFLGLCKMFLRQTVIATLIVSFILFIHVRVYNIRNEFALNLYLPIFYACYFIII